MLAKRLRSDRRHLSKSTSSYTNNLAFSHAPCKPKFRIAQCALWKEHKGLGISRDYPTEGGKSVNFFKVNFILMNSWNSHLYHFINTPHWLMDIRNHPLTSCLSSCRCSKETQPKTVKPYSNLSTIAESLGLEKKRGTISWTCLTLLFNY